MPNKVLGILLILIMLGLIFTGIFDPTLSEPHENPVIDKLEIGLGLALVIFGFWAGGRLIIIDKKTANNNSAGPDTPR